jgi:hypothetical protein
MLASSLSLFLSLSCSFSSRTGALNIPIDEVRVIGRTDGRSVSRAASHPFGVTTIGAPRKLNEPRRNAVLKFYAPSRIATSVASMSTVQLGELILSPAKDEARPAWSRLSKGECAPLRDPAKETNVSLEMIFHLALFYVPREREREKGDIALVMVVLNFDIENYFIYETSNEEKYRILPMTGVIFAGKEEKK